jgi:hypothetical protein
MCTPATVYLVVAILFTITAMVQNAGNTNKMCIGRVECNVKSTPALFIIEILWIVFWTWVLNSLCKNGHSSVAWFLVLLPFIVIFIMLVMFADMVSGNEQAMRALLEQTSQDVSNHQLAGDMALNKHLQSGYLNSWNQFSGVQIYQI